MFRSMLCTTVVVAILAGNAWAVPVPVASYLFEDNLQDSSGNNNHGTAVGGIGYADNAANGTRGLSLTNYSDTVMDYVSCPNNVGASSVLTLSFTMNPSADKESWPISKVFSESSGAKSGWGIKLYDPAAGQKLAIMIQYGTGKKYVVANTGWEVGLAQHYAIVAYADGSVGIYLNGQLDKFQAGVGQILATTTRDLGIGSFSNGNSPEDDYAGLLDDVNIWHEALSDTDIQEVYQMAIPEPASGLLLALGALAVLRWRFGW